MFLSGLKQIFKLATCSTYAILLILKCSGKGMYESIPELWKGSFLILYKTSCFYFAVAKIN